MATAADAELILRLYELRRESRMREARNWVVHEFNPKTLDELLAVQRDFGSEHNQFWRQVISYWEMAAAFVLRGVLDGDLFFDSVGEIILSRRSLGASRRSTPSAAGRRGSCPMRLSWWNAIRRRGSGGRRCGRRSSRRYSLKSLSCIWHLRGSGESAGRLPKYSRLWYNHYGHPSGSRRRATREALW